MRLTGKSVLLTAAQNAGDQDVIRVSEQDIGSDRSVTLVVRLERNPVPVLFTGSTPLAQVLVKITIVNGVGVQIQRNFVLVATNPRTIEIVGAKSIVVTAALISAATYGNPYPNAVSPPNPALGTLAKVSVLATTETVDFLGYDYAVWNATGAPNNSSGGSPIASPGALLAAQGGVTNMGGATALYLWFLDTQDAYISGFTVTAPGSGYAPGTTSIGFSFSSVGAGPGRVSPQTAPVVTTGGGGAITSIAFPANTPIDFTGQQGLGMLTPPTVLIAGAGTLATATAQVTVAPSRYILPVLGPFFAPGPFALTDELKDALQFEAGLCWGLSSDPFTFTLVAGAAARVDTKVAQ